MQEETLEGMFRQFEKKLQSQYTKALDTPLDKLLLEFKIKFENEPLMQSADFVKWTEINFDESHKINEILDVLAIHAAIYKEAREKVFNFVYDTVKPQKLEHAFYCNPNRKELLIAKLKKQDLYNFNTFKNEAEKTSLQVKDLVYSNFLSDYIRAFNNKSVATKNPKYKDLDMDNAFKKSKKLSINEISKIEFIKENFLPILKYYAQSPAMSIYFLITLQDDESFPILEECYNELVKHGVDFNKLVYCWSDSAHMPLNRFLLYDSHPPTIDFLISKGLNLSVFKPCQEVKIKSSKEDVIKYTFKNIKNDYDWQDSDKEGLKALLERQTLSSTVPKANARAQTKNSIKL